MSSSWVVEIMLPQSLAELGKIMKSVKGRAAGHSTGVVLHSAFLRWMQYRAHEQQL